MSALTTLGHLPSTPRRTGDNGPSDGTGYRIVCLDKARATLWARWDQFIVNCPRGQMAQLSTWLQSFAPYGGETTILAAVRPRSERILGGIGMVHFGRGFGGWLNAPSGPVIEQGYDDLIGPLMQAALEHARRRGAWALQIQPAAARADYEMLLSASLLEGEPKPRGGCGIKLGLGTRSLKWIPFPRTSDDDLWRQRLLAGFNDNTRRNIRQGERHPVEVREAVGEQNLREAYSVIERNGQEQGYATRRWDDFGPALLEQHRRGQAHVLTACHEGELIGAHYSLVAGERLTYVMAGTLRRPKDLKIGHLLHWSAMRKARRLGLSGYDLSSGGSPGVLRFKRGFRPLEIEFDPPCQYVLAPIRWGGLCRLIQGFQSHKAGLAKLGGLLRRRQCAAEEGPC